MQSNDDKDLKNYTDKLRKVAKLNKLVIFIGSGVSKNVPDMPSWSNLISKMAESIGYSRCDTCKKKDNCKDKDLVNTNQTNKCELLYDYSSDELMKIPQFVYNINPDTYESIIKEQISDRLIPEFPITQKIFEINPTHIITTNYDRIIESSSCEHRNQYDVVISDKDLLNSEKSKYIIKMHGDILQPQTIVLKEKDYLEYSQEHVVIELFIKALLTDHTFLFLGYSLTDYNVKQIISWINYLRSNNEISKECGYIVLDSEEIDSNVVEYFRKNNINVLNIHYYSLIKDIPNELTDEKGKRLYSFLSLIRDQSLLKDILPSASFEDAADIINSNKINDFAILLSFLGIKEYKKKESTLELYDKKAGEIFNQFVDYCEKADEKANMFKQSLINVGIRTIEYCDGEKIYSYTIGSEVKPDLDQDVLYSLYLQNKYSEIVDLGVKEENILKRSFYNFLVSEDLSIIDEYNRIDFIKLTQNEKVTFLHNKAILEALRTSKFDSSKVKNYISNIASEDERRFFQFYLDMYEGNSAKKFKMLVHLNKLHENLNSNSTYFFEGYSYGELYNIKNIALTYYYQNFDNYLLMPKNLSDTKEFFKPYIEAIISASEDKVVRKINISGLKAKYDKYPIDEVDIDFLSKFISVRDLDKLLNTYKITYFRMDRKVIEHIVVCYVDIINSITDGKVIDRKGIHITILANLSLLLTRTILEERDKNEIIVAIRDLLLSEKFHSCFWNILFTDIHICLKAFTLLLEKVNFSIEVNCLSYILNSPGFIDVLRNRFTEVKDLIKHIINGENTKEDELYAFIEKDEKNKMLMLELLFDWIKNSKKQEEYSKYLLSNVSNLSSIAHCSFVLNGWIKLDEKNKQELLDDVIELYHGKNPAIHTFPSQLERKLEEVYIFYISGLIEDISSLDELSKDYVYLDFLLHPNTFDYSQVDFSNYMWMNFASHEKLMQYFIDNKKYIIPTLKDRIRKESATEYERKILYGFFMEPEELLCAE